MNLTSNSNPSPLIISGPHLHRHDIRHLDGQLRVEEGPHGEDCRQTMVPGNVCRALHALWIGSNPHEVDDEVEHRHRPKDVEACTQSVLIDHRRACSASMTNMKVT
jgi:hypothetical protein